MGLRPLSEREVKDYIGQGVLDIKLDYANSQSYFSSENDIRINQTNKVRALKKLGFSAACEGWGPKYFIAIDHVEVPAFYGSSSIHIVAEPGIQVRTAGHNRVTQIDRSVVYNKAFTKRFSRDLLKDDWRGPEVDILHDAKDLKSAFKLWRMMKDRDSCRGAAKRLVYEEHGLENVAGTLVKVINNDAASDYGVIPQDVHLILSYMRAFTLERNEAIKHAKKLKAAEGAIEARYQNGRTVTTLDLEKGDMTPSFSKAASAIQSMRDRRKQALTKKDASKDTQAEKTKGLTPLMMMALRSGDPTLVAELIKRNKKNYPRF